VDCEPRVLSDPPVGTALRGRAPSLRCSVLIASTCAATIGLALASPAASVIVTWLVAPLFHGTSNGAALTFLAIVALGAVRLCAARAPSAESATRAERLGVVALLAAVLLGNAAAIGGHFLALDAVDVPWRFAAYFWSGDTNTYSYWLHSHAGKAALTPWLEALLPATTSYDFGRGLGASLPGWVGAACGLAVAAGTGLLLWLAPGIVARSGGGFAAAAVTIVAGSNCVKTIIDGGPLTYRFLPCFVALAAVALTWERDALGRNVRWALVAGAVSIAGYCVLWWSVAPAGGTVEPVFSLGALLAVLTLPSLVAVKPVAATMATLRRVAVVVAVVVVGASYLVTGALGPALYLAPLPASYRATVVEPATLATRVVPVGGESPLEVYARFGDDPLKPRRVFLSAPESAGSTSFMFLLSLVETGESQEIAAAPVAIDSVSGGDMSPSTKLMVASVRSADIPQIFGADANALTTNNYYVFLHLVAARLRTLGFAEFAIAPLRDADDLRGLERRGEP
jgi:hypothetical protein